MNVRCSSVGLVVLSICGVLQCFYCSEVYAQTMTAAVPPQDKMPWQKIDEKARAAKAGDEASVRALTDEVFNHPHGFPRMPAPLETLVKDRLVRAELAYRQGWGKGVHENDIARLVNLLAVRLGAPDYARTSTHQVRIIRLNLLVSTPLFMGEGMTHDNMRLGESINATMSPLQAVYVSALLIDQKLANPEFQVTPGQWETDRHQKAIERWRALKAAKESGQTASAEQGLTPKVVVMTDNPKRQEMREALARGIASISLIDALNLADEALDMLGIGL